MTTLEPNPLLTIAIPTFNRSELLRELLNSLVPQLEANTEVELIISDNCSPDQTMQVIDDIAGDLGCLRYVQNTENIGSDDNFIQCFHLAKGRYFWLLGDDDILLPGAISKILSLLAHHSPDVVHLCSSHFREDHRAEIKPDPLGRGYRLIKDPSCFIGIANIMLTFISSNIVCRARLQELKAQPIELARGTHLIQLSWLLPLLTTRRDKIVVFERLLAGRDNYSGGYNVAAVLGTNLLREAERLLGSDTFIVRKLISTALRRWFPPEIVALRRAGDLGRLDSIQNILSASFGRSRVFQWLVAPFFWLPLPAATALLPVSRSINKLLYIANLPDFWRSRRDY